MECESIHDMEYLIELFASEFIANVAYSVTGKFRPATMIDPAEYAEVELVHVKLFGNDILPELNAADQAIIIDACEEDMIEQKQDDFDAKAECKADFYRDELRLAA